MGRINDVYYKSIKIEELSDGQLATLRKEINQELTKRLANFKGITGQ